MREYGCTDTVSAPGCMGNETEVTCNCVTDYCNSPQYVLNGINLAATAPANATTKLPLIVTTAEADVTATDMPSTGGVLSGVQSSGSVSAVPVQASGQPPTG